MVNSIQERAHARFSQIANMAKASLAEGTLRQDLGAGKYQVPQGLCISTVGRLKLNSPLSINEVQSIQERLLNASIGTTNYSAESLHVSLLGCTQRSPVNYDSESKQKIGSIIGAELSATPEIKFDYGSLNLIDNQLFIELIPTNTDWSSIRQEVGESLRLAGFNPMSHPDTEPTHLNIGRITRLDIASEKELLSILSQKPKLSGSLIISKIELIQTDFVLAPESLEHIATYELDASI